MDALRHPDLERLARRMRSTFDRAIEAEQAAAEIAHRRTRELRELLMELEDRSSTVRVVAGGHQIPPARLSAVGIDHILIGSCCQLVGYVSDVFLFDQHSNLVSILGTL